MTIYVRIRWHSEKYGAVRPNARPACVLRDESDQTSGNGSIFSKVSVFEKHNEV
jgi:hypothetical protein